MKQKKAVRSTESEVVFTRAQVACVLEMTEAEVESMDGSELHPVRSADRRLRYRPEDVLRAVRLHLGTSERGLDGKLTARIFALLRDGKSRADIAIEAEQTAATVNAAAADYAQMAGALLLPREAVEALVSAVGGTVVGDGGALASQVIAELDRRYRRGFDEGRADRDDFGEVVDHNGHRRPVGEPPSAAS